MEKCLNINWWWNASVQQRRIERTVPIIFHSSEMQKIYHTENSNTNLPQSSSFPQSGSFPPIYGHGFLLAGLTGPRQAFPGPAKTAAALRLQHMIQILLILTFQRTLRTHVPRVGRPEPPITIGFTIEVILGLLVSVIVGVEASLCLRFFKKLSWTTADRVHCWWTCCIYTLITALKS